MAFQLGLKAMILKNLVKIIKDRKKSISKDSYTYSLFEKGLGRCGQKFGEEAVELIVASLEGDKKHAKQEAADVLFHYLVLLEAQGIQFDEILIILEQRMTMSGLEEKLARHKDES